MLSSNKIKITNLRLKLRNNIKDLINKVTINVIELSDDELSEREINIWHEYNLNVMRLLFTGATESNKESLNKNISTLKKIIRKKTQEIDTPTNITKNHQLAIFTSQLLGLNHSPTYVTLMLAIDFINEGFKPIIINTNLLETEDQLGIFKANHLKHDENNYKLTMLESGEVTSTHYHDGCVISINGINIDYFNMQGGTFEKAEIFDSINKFMNNHRIPSISIGDDFYPDTTKQKFSGYYLPLSIENQGTESTKRFIFKSKDKKNDNHYLINFPYKGKEFTSISKKNTSEKIRVCIVGNRLDVEIDNDFVEQLNFIESMTNNVEFYIVGCASHEKINSEKITFIPYASNLIDFYQTHNISAFLNPKRHGGGYSAFYAMQAGIPVITPSYGDVHYVSNGMFNYSNKEELLTIIKEIECGDKASISKKIKTRVDELSNHKALINHVIQSHLI